MRLISLFILFSITTCLAEEDFIVPKSMLDTAEKRLAAERNPTKRLEILFRWVKIKEEYEQNQLAISKDPSQVDQFNHSKSEIVEKLRAEAVSLKRVPGLRLDKLHRELAFRLLEIKNFAESKIEFESLSSRTSDDEIAYGDCLLGSKLISAALDAYAKSGEDPKLKTMAAYKRGWAYLQLNDFSHSLAEFSLALEDNPNSPAKMREEAYKDRLKPYIEVYAKTDFDEDEAKALKDLAEKVKPTEKSSEKQPEGLYVEALKSLVEGFNAKNDVQKAQQVFQFLTKEMPDSSLVLLSAAPVWLKVYRGRLDHDAVERIIASLPSKEFPVQQALNLQSEMQNTAGFYETLIQEDKDPNFKELRATALLLNLYQKYFQIFSSDPESDALRVNYGRLLLKGGDAGACLDILAKRSKKNATVETVAGSIEAQCELKHLDQLYAKAHDDYFYGKLDRALIQTKIYNRSEIGIPPEQAFSSMVAMLMGALKKNSKAEMLRKTLTGVRDEFPFPKNEKLFREIKIVSAELQFDDLVAENSDPNEKSNKFFEIFKVVPADTAVAQKSIRNSILLGTEKSTLDRCDRFIQDYSKEFTKGSDVYGRCLRLAEEHLRLDKEYAYWKFHENELEATQVMRVGLIELALGMETQGKRRIQYLKTEAAQRVLDLWYGVSPAKVPVNPKLKIVEQDAQYFASSLKKISFGKIGKMVPFTIDRFRTMDKELVRFSKADTNPYVTAKILELRSLIAVRMRDWMKTLPEPAGLTEEELQQYREKTKEVIKPWELLASQSLKECSEAAYALSPDFQNSEFCPEATADATWNTFLQKWDATRQPYASLTPWFKESETDTQRTLRILMEAGFSEPEPLKARYFLLRSLDLATENRDKAKIHLALAKLTDKERFWIAAGELDGNLIQPIEWLRYRAVSNPFFEKIYNYEIELIRKNDRFVPRKDSSVAQAN
jgi:hypothetical protein